MQKRNVAVIILKNDGKFLLQKRGKDAKRMPGSWGLFGGGININEKPESALKREIVEELGLKLKNPVLIDIYPYILNETDEIGNVYVFCEEYAGESKLKLNEGEEMAWFTKDDALKLNISKIYRQIIEEIV